MTYSCRELAHGLEAFTFTGKAPGPRLLVFGAIHGNETAGPEAIRRTMEALGSERVNLVQGTLTFVPVCNVEAYAKNQRFIEKDLNRVFRRHRSPASYEERLAESLAPLIEETDVFLDVHSTSAAGPFSLFVDFPTHENKALAESLGAEHAILNWPAVYENTTHPFESFDTTRFAFEHGKTGIIVECGQHDAAETVANAEQAIIRTLAHVGMLEPTKPLTEAPMQTVCMVSLFAKGHNDDRFMKDWRHLELIPAGAVIARRKSGERVLADKDYVMILPKHHAKKGEEWFYLAVAG